MVAFQLRKHDGIWQPLSFKRDSKIWAVEPITKEKRQKLQGENIIIIVQYDTSLMHDPSLNQLNIKYKKKRNNNQDDNNEDMKENMLHSNQRNSIKTLVSKIKGDTLKKTNFIHEHKQGGNRKWNRNGLDESKLRTSRSSPLRHYQAQEIATNTSNDSDKPQIFKQFLHYTKSTAAKTNLNTKV